MDLSEGKWAWRFATWNVKRMYRAGSLRTVAEEVLKYKLDLVGIQEVRWDGGGPEPAGQYTFFYGKENQNHELGTGVFVHKRIISVQVKEDEMGRACSTNGGDEECI
jgi:exonuclease III